MMETWSGWEWRVSSVLNFLIKKNVIFQESEKAINFNIPDQSSFEYHSFLSSYRVYDIYIVVSDLNGYKIYIFADEGMIELRKYHFIRFPTTSIYHIQFRLYLLLFLLLFI